MRSGDLVSTLTGPELSDPFRRSVLTSIAARETHSTTLLAGLVQQSGARTRTSRTITHIQTLAEEVNLDNSTLARVVDRVERLSGKQLQSMTSHQVRDVDPQRSDNLICGRVGEQLLADQFHSWRSAQLKNHTDQHHFFDMTLEYDDGTRLLVNAKTFSRRFDQAQRHVGLRSDDAIALATYKILGMADAHPQHPQAIISLAMWDYADQIKTRWLRSLPSAAQTAWQVIRRSAVPRSGVEDQFLRNYLDDEAITLWNTVTRGKTPQFRVCSVAKALRTLLTCPKRTPAISSPGRYNTQPNVHLSLEEDTISLSELHERHAESSGGYPVPATVRHAIPQIRI